MTPPEQLSDGLFDALVDLTRQGSTGVRDFVDWKRLAEAAPGRCFRLLEARIESDLGRFEAMLGGGAGDRVDRDDSSLLIGQAALARAAAAMPVEAWDRLMPRFREANRLSVAVRRRTRRGAWNDLLFDLGRLARRTKHMLRVILTEAGKAMALASPDSFWDHVASESPGTRSIDRLLARCISYGPDDRADAAICWLLANPLRLRCGTGDRGSVYRPAWRLLRRYVGHCSDALFAELQVAILAHRPEVERESYKLYHNRQRREEFWGEHSFDVLKCNDLGLGQYLLLSALPPDHLPPVVRDWAGVLRRKFGPPKLLLKKTPRRSGGWVGSTIPHDRLHLLSDDQWLGIIRGHWPQRSHRWKPMGSDAIGEASVEMFARDLGHMAGRQPHCFARLAQRMPRDADPRYVTAILHALGVTEPPDQMPEEGWGPATVEQIEAIVGRFQALETDSEFAMALCRAVWQRGNAEWGDRMLERLARLAVIHPEPRVRGAAAVAIGAVLFGRPGTLSLLRPAVELLLNDPHPAVRVAAVGLTLPLLNVDREEAIAAFLTTCSHPDDEVLRHHDVNQFLDHTILRYLDRIAPLIERMVGSAIDEVAKNGAGWATVAWVHRGTMIALVDSCMIGSSPQRQGVAEALVQAVKVGRA